MSYTTESLPVITEQQSVFLKNLDLSSYQKKLEAITKAYSGLHLPNSQLKLSTEEEYKSFLEAVLLGEWDVDSGKSYINIGAVIDIPIFLVKKSDDNGDVWDTTNNLTNATLFTQETLAELPSEYQIEGFVVKEYIALRKYGSSLNIEELGSETHLSEEIQNELVETKNVEETEEGETNSSEEVQNELVKTEETEGITEPRKTIQVLHRPQAGVIFNPDDFNKNKEKAPSVNTVKASIKLN